MATLLLQIPPIASLTGVTLFEGGVGGARAGGECALMRAWESRECCTYSVTVPPQIAALNASLTEVTLFAGGQQLVVNAPALRRAWESKGCCTQSVTGPHQLQVLLK